MSSLTVRDIQGLSTYSNTVRVPTGNTLNVEGRFKLPVYTDSTLPASATVGEMIFNSTSNIPLFWNGTGWVTVNGASATLGASADYPANNARAILAVAPSSPSGFYWIKGANNKPIRMYCDMTGSNQTDHGSSLTGWMRFDESVLTTYLGAGIEQTTYGYTYQGAGGLASSNGLYLAAQNLDGILRAIRWDLGPNIQFTGFRWRRLRFYSINGPDGYYTYDAPTPNWGSSQPSISQIISATNGNSNGLGSNFTSFGVGSLSSTFATGTVNVDYARTYTGTNQPQWTGEVNGGYVDLQPNSFTVQIDNTLNAQRYVTFYESDGGTEVDNIHNWTLWIR